MSKYVVKKNGVVYEGGTLQTTNNFVSVQADGVKTYGQLLKELGLLIDSSRVTRDAVLVEKFTYTETFTTRVLVVSGFDDSRVTLCRTNYDMLRAVIYYDGSSSTYDSTNLVTDTGTDYTNSVASNTVSFFFYYSSALALDKSQGSGGGHTIVNSSGTAMDAEPSLQFTDSHLTDDSENSRTKVTVIKDETTSAFETETKPGLYHITDEPDGMLTGANVYYKNGESVEDALDTLYDGTGEYEEVVADGVKTYGQLLNELYALVDKSKLNASTKLVISVPNVSDYVFAYTTYIKSVNKILFNSENGSSLNFTNVLSVSVTSSGSLYQSARIQTNGNVYSDYTSDVPASSSTLRLYYSAITKIINETESDSVSVTADGVKTYAQLLNSFYSLLDRSKIDDKSYVEFVKPNGAKYTVPLTCEYSNALLFTGTTEYAANTMYYRVFKLATSSSFMEERSNSSDTVYESQVVPSGTTLTLYYTSTSRVIESCESQNVAYRGTNVRSALDGLRSWGEKQTFTPSSYTSWSSYGNCYYRKKGTTVELNVSLGGAAGADSVSIATLPAGYRPVHSVGSVAISIVTSSLAAGGLYVDAGGVVRITSPNAYFIGHMYFETV